MNRRGFTLLETSMAALIGLLMVVACLGVFALMERSDTALARRSRDVAEMERIRTVFSRLFGSVLMSETSPPATRAEGEAGADAPDRAGRNPSRLRERQEEIPPPARVILDYDPAQQGATMFSRFTDDAGRGTPVQALELVVHDPPVPLADEDDFEKARRRLRLAGMQVVSGDGRSDEDRRASVASREDRIRRRREERERDRSAIREGEATPAATEVSEVEEWLTPVRASRGRLELRPSQSLAGIEDGRSAWELWWVPLAPAAPDNVVIPPDILLEAPGEPFLIASNIAYMRVRFFDDGELRDRLSAVWFTQLPAYAEVFIETTGGLYGQWLFEMRWAMGPEIIIPARASDGVARPESDESAAGEGAAAGGDKPGNAAPRSGAGAPRGGTPPGRRGPR